jgi:hypothetical protein
MFRRHADRWRCGPNKKYEAIVMRLTRLQQHRSKWQTGLLLVALVGCPILAGAATIQAIGTNKLLSDSGLIFHGRVLERWSEAGAVGDAIVTKVVFEIADLIKGEYSSDVIVLQFLGGTLTGLRMHIAGTNVPKVGEEGIYFIEDPDRNFVNPLYGWTQGHYVVVPEDGAVRTFGGQLVYALRADAGPAKLEFAKGHAKGVSVVKTTSDSMPLSVDQFKQQLRVLLEKSSQ